MYRGGMGRTNIDIDDELIERVMQQKGLPTKKAAVDYALRQVVVEPMSLQAAKAMRGSGWHGDLDAMRRPRDWTNE